MRNIIVSNSETSVIPAVVRSPAVVGAATAVVGAAVIAPILAPPILGIFGFSAMGPVAGVSHHNDSSYPLD